MRIAFFGLKETEEKMVRERLTAHELYFSAEPLSPQISFPRNDFDAIAVFVDSKIDGAALERFPNLKFVATMSTGFDHIDLEACKKRNIAVAYVPGYGDNTVAEFAFGLILNLTRKIYQGIDQLKEHGSFRQDELCGIDLKGKTIGVIGTGRIGKESIKIAKGFGMKVIAYDIYQDSVFQKEMGFPYVPLEELLQNSDVITIHCPYNKSTHHLINKENIRLIKRGAYLVNTARGGIIETDALVMALTDGTLAGAGLDVLEEEMETKADIRLLTEEMSRAHDDEKIKIALQNHMLMKMPNVLITPHNAFNSCEALQRILETTIANIEGFIGGKPVNLVP